MKADLWLRMIHRQEDPAGEAAYGLQDTFRFEEAPGDGSEAALFSRTKNLDERWADWINQVDR